MVKIIVFVPYMDMQEQFETIVAGYKNLIDIQIKLKYVLGTPGSLENDNDAEILVARGMMYHQLKILFPQKHIVEIHLSSFDILEALMICKDKYHPSRIALCVHNVPITSIHHLEANCNAKIDIYDAKDEITAKSIIEMGQKKETDVYVGAGVICNLCDQKGLNRVHIKTKDNTVQSAMEEAIRAAFTINREREEHTIFRTIINNNKDAIISINCNGVITQINNRSYHYFQLASYGDMKGKSIDIACPGLKWRDTMDDQCPLEEVYCFHENNYYVGYQPVHVDKRKTGVILTFTSAEQIFLEETKIRRSLRDRGLTAKYTFHDIIGSSAKLKDNIYMANRYSKVDSSVLIIGETGTGKELFAHGIHHASSRSNQPFVAVNCAAFPESLLESELFGYESGAFSGATKGGKTGLFEVAHKGTIFLDEIGEIPITLQAKLLRVLQEKEIRRIGGSTVYPIDVRIISATNIDIEQKMKEGKFRIDLYYRLNLLDIVIPPLRERKEDIKELLEHFLVQFTCELKKSIPKLSANALRILSSYDWPGNVRELRNICERLVVLNDSGRITSKDVYQFEIFREKTKKEDVRKAIEDNNPIEIRIPLKSKRTRQDIADALGISRTTLWRLAKEQEEK